jgi:hypothetical protein
MVLEVIRKHHRNRRRSSNPSTSDLRAMKRLAPEIRLSALWRPAICGDWAGSGRGIVSPAFNLVTGERVKQRTPPTGSTALNANTADWDRLAAAGMDGMITDDPRR